MVTPRSILPTATLPGLSPFAGPPHFRSESYSAFSLVSGLSHLTRFKSHPRHSTGQNLTPAYGSSFHSMDISHPVHPLVTVGLNGQRETI